MVGVPGRSKGCHTCLKRRVKCDESRPTCKRCEKAGFTCGGYERKLEMRFHSFSNKTDSATLAKTTKRPLSFASGISEFHVLKSNDIAHQGVPQELNLSAFREDIQFTYLFDNFVWSSYGSPWLQMSAGGKVDVLALEACRAFSLTIFGRHHHQSDIEVSGAVHYDKAVRALSSRLSNVGAPGSEDMIVPIMILLMHSSSIPDPQACAFHIQGLLKLIQICGPQRFQTPVLRTAFESCRATLVTVALITKTRSFLESSEWLLEPWAEIGAANKNFQNQLVDILVHIPGFLQDQGELEQSFDAELEQSLTRRVEFQVERLFQWRWRWEESNLNAVWEIEPDQLSTETPLSSMRPAGPVLMFSSFTRAAEISLYNAVLLCLLGLLWTLKHSEESTPSPVAETTSPLNLPTDVTSLTEPALEICRTFEYQVAHASKNSASALFWLFPLGLASKVLEDDPTMMRWIKSMLETSQITKGYGTGANTYGFGFYKFPAIKRRKADIKPLIQPYYRREIVHRILEGSWAEEQ